VIEAATWSNALEVYGQSGQLDLARLNGSIQVDQRGLFGDSTILRGQAPRVDTPVS